MSPVNPIAAGWWNVLICSGIVAVGIHAGATDQPIFFAFAVLAAAMDVLFIVRLIAAYRARQDGAANE